MPKGIYKHKPLSPERKVKAINNIKSFQFKAGHPTNNGSFKIGHKINLGKKRKPLSIDHKNKISNSGKGKHNLFGEQTSNWKGGISPIYKRIRNGTQFRLWREAIFARDNWTCQKYETRGCKLHPHHIYGFAQYPELRFVIDNGITLSEKAHKEFHKKYGYKSNTIEQIEEFLYEK